MNLTNNLGKTFQQSSPKAGKEDENTTDQRQAAADKEVDDFLADNI